MIELVEIKQEMQLAGYAVGEFSDLKSIAKTIMDMVDTAYEKGFIAGGGHGKDAANKALMDQIVAVSHALEDLVRARHAVVLREQRPIDPDEWRAFLRANRVLRQISSGNI